MGISIALEKRCEGKCELCNSANNLDTFIVPPKVDDTLENIISICSECLTNLNNIEASDANYWRCLNDSMWNPNPSVQVVVFRILSQLCEYNWAQDLKNMMYLDDHNLEWANQGLQQSQIIHKDSNGNILTSGDSVTLIQDLNVKGAGFTAKRGTPVRRIRLVHDNPEHIEGKVEGQQIVILTKYVKKS